MIPGLFLQGDQRVSVSPSVPGISLFVHWQSRAVVRGVFSPTDLLMSLIYSPRQSRALTLVSCTDCHCNLWERKWNQCRLWLDKSHNLPVVWWMSSTSWCLVSVKETLLYKSASDLLWLIVFSRRSFLCYKTFSWNHFATFTCWQLNIIEMKRFWFLYIFIEMVCDYPPTVTQSLCSWQMVDALFNPRGSNAAPRSSFQMIFEEM